MSTTAKLNQINDQTIQNMTKYKIKLGSNFDDIEKLSIHSRIDVINNQLGNNDNWKQKTELQTRIDKLKQQLQHCKRRKTNNNQQLTFSEATLMVDINRLKEELMELSGLHGNDRKLLIRSKNNLLGQLSRGKTKENGNTLRKCLKRNKRRHLRCETKLKDLNK